MRLPLNVSPKDVVGYLKNHFIYSEGKVGLAEAWGVGGGGGSRFRSPGYFPTSPSNRCRHLRHPRHPPRQSEFRTVAALTTRSLDQIQQAHPNVVEELCADASILLASAWKKKRNAYVSLKKVGFAGLQVTTIINRT